MTTYIAPLDLQNILVNIFAGSPFLFSLLAIIGISLLAGKFRMPDKVFIMCIILFGVMMSAYLEGLYILIIVVVGLILYYSIAKLVKQ